jgi:hypothetical protein
MSNECVHEETYRRCNIKIFQDDCYEHFFDDLKYDEDVIFVHYHRDLWLERKDVICEDDLRAYMQGEKIPQEKEYHIFLTRAYIHSGAHVSLVDEGVPYPDERWDVSRCGCVLVVKKHWRMRKSARKAASGHLNYVNDLMSGNVWGFQIEDQDGKDIDSCWGFAGDYDKYCLVDARSVVDCHINANPRQQPLPGLQVENYERL